MQQNKGIPKIGTVGDDGAKNVETIFHVLSTMKIARIGKFFDSIKRCGVNVSDILVLLLLMPFFHIKSVPLLAKSNLAQAQGLIVVTVFTTIKKNNPKVNWRSLLYLVAMRFMDLAGKVNPNMANAIRAFIFDDSPLPKTSSKTELVSRVHDHVSGDFILGYKLLVMGYWDGLIFYPLDFSIHREKGGKIGTVKQSLEIANKRLKSQRLVLKEEALRLDQAQQLLKSAKKENKGKNNKAALKQTKQVAGKAKRAKQKMKEAETKYAVLENKAILLRQELKETQKKMPYIWPAKKANG